MKPFYSRAFQPTPVAFIAFASADAYARDLLAIQGRAARTPWSFIDNSVHAPFSDLRWKSQVGPLIQQSDLVLLLLSENTASAQGALWEADYALSHEVLTVGVYVHRNRWVYLP